MRKGYYNPVTIMAGFCKLFCHPNIFSGGTCAKYQFFAKKYIEKHEKITPDKKTVTKWLQFSGNVL
ncbi:MAG TPA: hypothetical protein IAB51_08865 [Candidatus Merdivicinus excrementipullorum]|uniref:Uncharacterized protein n=1 Tax=Candidatus Merdivicinus excrementipullorum TaxID=2840867 RepID=A0A9D1FPB9_9FIRM|nr:hypothetical protein [Candidatus Merdivicinus excrementipullorum]